MLHKQPDFMDCCVVRQVHWATIYENSHKEMNK